MNPLLPERLKAIEDAIAGGAREEAVILDAVDRFDAVAEFGSGTHWFSLAGVRGSSTMSYGGALQSWCRLARKKLEAEAVAQ